MSFVKWLRSSYIGARSDRMVRSSADGQTEEQKEAEEETFVAS